MTDKAIDRFDVDIEPEERSGSFWHHLAFLRVNMAGDLATQAVAAEQGGTAPSAVPASRVVIRDTTTDREVWHVNGSDLTGGTSLEQLQEDIGNDLMGMTVEQFVAKWGITDAP